MLVSDVRLLSDLTAPALTQVEPTPFAVVAPNEIQKLTTARTSSLSTQQVFVDTGRLKYLEAERWLPYGVQIMYSPV